MYIPIPYGSVHVKDRNQCVSPEQSVRQFLRIFYEILMWPYQHIAQ